MGIAGVVLARRLDADEWQSNPYQEADDNDANRRRAFRITLIRQRSPTTSKPTRSRSINLSLIQIVGKEIETSPGIDTIVEHMALKGRGRFYEHAKGKVILYVPAGLAKDSAFPFRIGEPVQVTISKGRLVVQKL